MESAAKLRKPLLTRPDRYWFLLLAASLFALPSLFNLAEHEWSTEQGAAGPIILASGLWLLVREAKTIHITAHTPPVWMILPLVAILSGYALGRVMGMVWLEWLSVYVALLWIALAYFSLAVITRLWFPLTYLMFLVPPPYALMAPLTHSRKAWLATTAVNLLSDMGFDVAHQGATLYIDQYELLIADACAGMNSLVSLLAITLFYVYVLHRANWRYALLLAILAVPVAMFANLIRVMTLMLAAHYLGIEAAEGVIHEMAGIIMFLVALATLIGVDALLAPLRRLLQRP